MGLAKRPAISVEPELADGYAALGYARTIANEVKTDWFFNDVMELAYSAMSVDFDAVATAAASTNKNGFRHVYEPGYVGVPHMKLWTMKFYGQGMKREVSWEWKMATLPILNAEERSWDRSDAMSKVDDDDIIDRLTESDYVFRMQAPVMEYNLHVETAAKHAKALFIPTWAKQRAPKTKNGKRAFAPRNYKFEKYNTPDFSFRNPQDHSGKTGGTAGNFTALWVSYWNGGGAEMVWDSQIAPALERGLTEGIEGDLQKLGRSRVKKKRTTGVSLMTFNDTAAAKESGANLARAFIKGKARSYRAAARHIDKKGVFGGDRTL